MSQQQLTKLQQKAKQPSARRAPSPASDSSRQGDVHPILQLQRAIGNRRVAQLIQAKRLTPQGTILGPQRKLTVGAGGDFHEREADDVARRVLATPDAAIAAPPLAGAPNEPHPGKGLAASITPVMQRRLRQDEEEGNPTLPFPAAGGRFEAGIDIEKQVELSKGHGDPLPNHVRNYMEPRFGADFGQVRIHTGSDAAQMSKDIGAQAFTHGSNIYFGNGHHPTDLALTAHELTHVIQQGDASVPGSAAGPSVVQRKEFDPLYPRWLRLRPSQASSGPTSWGPDIWRILTSQRFSPSRRTAPNGTARQALPWFRHRRWTTRSPLTAKRSCCA
jgi:hypothetical protein